MRIVFMGTPDFAVASLNILVANKFDVVGVITAPDKPAGRGSKLRQSAVKEYALEHNLNVLQPTNLKSPEFIETLSALNADLFIVVAFRMLPEVVWAMPPKGTFNLHGSLLPNYRGAAPINWAVINGEKKTGVTTFFLTHEIDTGAIIMQTETPIGADETVGDVHDRLMQLGAETVLATTKSIEQGQVTTRNQDMAGDYPKAPKIFKEDCEIYWNQPTDAVYNFIRGLSPYPAAFTYLADQQLKVYAGIKHIEQHNKKPGTIDYLAGKHIKYATQDGYIEITELQLQGKKKMSTQAFLLGYRP